MTIHKVLTAFMIFGIVTVSAVGDGEYIESKRF